MKHTIVVQIVNSGMSDGGLGSAIQGKQDKEIRMKRITVLVLLVLLMLVSVSVLAAQEVPDLRAAADRGVAEYIGSFDGASVFPTQAQVPATSKSPKWIMVGSGGVMAIIGAYLLATSSQSARVTVPGMGTITASVVSDGRRWGGVTLLGTGAVAVVYALAKYK